jgi:hypothetical protein
MGDDRWLAGGNGDIRYEVGSLAEFAERMRDRLKDFQDSMTNGVMPMAQAAMPGSQLAESELFARAHRTQIEASRKMVKDTIMGLMALQVGSQSVENQYQTGDALNAATNNSVMDTFHPFDSQYQTLSQITNEQGGQNGQNGQPGQPGAAPTQHDHDVAAQHDPDQTHGGGNDGNHTVHDGQVIAGGDPGEYVIPADDEGMRDAPRGPEPQE